MKYSKEKAFIRKQELLQIKASLIVGRICADFALNCSFCVKSTKFLQMIEFFILVNT